MKIFKSQFFILWIFLTYSKLQFSILEVKVRQDLTEHKLTDYSHFECVASPFHGVASPRRDYQDDKLSTSWASGKHSEQDTGQNSSFVFCKGVSGIAA
jgi:hypothetical protein